jgi:hypothetical protein
LKPAVPHHHHLLLLLLLVQLRWVTVVPSTPALQQAVSMAAAYVAAAAMVRWMLHGWLILLLG